MISSDLAKRYARAFFDIAVEERKIEDYGRELASFSTMVLQNKDLQEFLGNPIFELKAKKSVVEELLALVKMSDRTANFVRLLVDKQRIGMLAEVENAFKELMDKTLKKVRVSVRTAYPLSAELEQALKQRVAEMTGKEVEMTVEDDTSLIGGLVVRVGDTLYDGSIKAQLGNIRKLLGEER
ncbi:MAG: ATP synthase F1 subunit delta [Pseudomonadota bacterium]|nr:ATP synthase F1 subunit delta [Syntrophaceae bacterium]MBP7033289.1 ATP synthase F1 subunit delta [Syntrophobacterales bacterium]MDI9556074.1 ATP synthase F1 subunit delta [Pseudomonadota bacterium]NLX32549.1 ATP synthase F1 subunit delta [Deltaproteobacteria bacterium]HNU85966.1 ATP synthase F1 subunit delta [Syntrophales bacterium]